MHKVLALLFVATLTLTLATLAGAAPGSDSPVTVGSNPSPFSQNKQNEPALAIDANHPNIAGRGLERQHRHGGLQRRRRQRPARSRRASASRACTSRSTPATPGRSRRTRAGAPANCLGVVGTRRRRARRSRAARSGRCPWYFENGLVSDGDPAVAFGPRPDSSGHFSWANGSRLYYANLTSNFGATRDEASFKGFEAIAVSRTDNVAGSGRERQERLDATRDHLEAVLDDVLRQGADLGRQRRVEPVLRHRLRLLGVVPRPGEGPNAAPAPLFVAVSHDGGDTWTQHQITAAANNGQRNPTDGCTIRTDSHGDRLRVRRRHRLVAGPRRRSSSCRSRPTAARAGRKPRRSPARSTPAGRIDPALGRPVIDGVAGARSDLAPAPSVDIANGAPTGADATNRIVMTYVSGDLAKPHVYFTESTDRGHDLVDPACDRDGWWIAATTPRPRSHRTARTCTSSTTRSRRRSSRRPRRPGRSSGSSCTRTAGATGPDGRVQRDPPRPARRPARVSARTTSSAEFLGDYVYAAATRTYGAAVWNDTRNAADCPAIDAYRQALENGQTAATAPDVQQQCPATFGNSDIWAFTTAP